MSAAVSRVDPPTVPGATPDTRSSLLTAALGILQREGAGAMTVRSVAKAAGCSTTGVYTWFGGKNGLVEAIFVDGFERFGEAIRAVSPASEGRRPLDRIAHEYRTWALGNPTQYMVMFGRAVPDYVPSDEARVIAIGTFEDLVDATAGLIESAGLAGTPHDVAHHLWAGIHGYVSLELAGMDMAESDTERLERFRRGLTRLVRGCRS